MSVYKVDGRLASMLFDINGSVLQKAYDVNGNEVFDSEFSAFRVMQYNVGAWYIGSGTNVPSDKDAEYYALQNGMLTNDDPDILCIEEYWTKFSPSRNASTLLSAHFPYIHAENGGSQYFGRCICSKYPITAYTKKQFTVDTDRYYDCATIDKDGTDIYVFVTHFSTNNNTYKVEQSKQILDYIKANAIQNYIICGDFNSNMTNPMSTTTSGIFGRFTDDGASLANGGTFGIKQTYCNGTDWTNTTAIDNIIVSDSFTIASVQTDQTKITDGLNETIDHIPLIANLILN